MPEEMIYRNNQELQGAQLTAIVDAAKEIYRLNRNRPVRILDMATGPNGFNPLIVKNLVQEGIGYELVLSDISPTHFRIGYENLESVLSPEELQHVKCVLADVRDLRSELPKVLLWGEGAKWPLEEVLRDPRYHFLQTGYREGRRTVDFSDNSFDLVIGCIPYGSINTGDFSDAVRESARILRVNGYHIVDEMQVEKVQSYGLRVWYTLKEMLFGEPLREAFSKAIGCVSAMLRARRQHTQEVKDTLDMVLRPVTIYSATYKYDTIERFPEQTIQHGDLVKRIILVHQKA